MRSEDRWPPRSTRFRLVQPLLQMLAALGMIWAAVRVIAFGIVPMGIMLFAFGGITASLAARQLIRRFRSPDSGFESSGELSKDEFDYIVWVAVGLPVLLVLGLLIFVLAGLR